MRGAKNTQFNWENKMKQLAEGKLWEVARALCCAGVAAYLSAFAAPAAPQDAPPPSQTEQPTGQADQKAEAQAEVKKEEAKEFERVQVTGSRILRNQVEGPAPITIITGEDIERGGFATVSDVLNSLVQNNSVLQNEQNTNSFTANLTPLDLRGLGPGRTLVLLDGVRIPDYPGAYNGEANAVNVGAIPSVAIDRIEVLSGGASAIYGSDAVAGVINVVLRKDFTGYEATARFGDTTEGGGRSWRAQFTGGNHLLDNRLNLVYGLEYHDREPIWAFQRRLTDSNLDAPTANGRDPSRAYLILDDLGQGPTTYIDPGAEVCTNFEAVGLRYDFRDPQGHYCGTTTFNSLTTFRNADESYSGFIKAGFKLTDDIELYGHANYWQSDAFSKFSAPFWFSGSQTGTIVDATRPDDFGIGGQAVTFQRLFTVTETGDLEDSGTSHFDEQTYYLAAGLRGGLFRDYRYDLYVSHSRYDAEDSERRFLFDAVEDYFLGQPIGEAGGFLDGFGIMVYNPNYERLNNPLTPEVYRSLTDVYTNDNYSALDVANLSVTGSLLQLPAGAVQVAGVLEAARQRYELAPDPRLLPDAAEFWGITATGGKGERDRYAAGLEVRVPILEQLVSSAALRYDKYDDITSVDDAVTYNLGLEFRPISSLLARGSAATSFRAPDMHYVFAGDSGFFTTVDDFYKCRKYEPDVDIGDCTYAAQNPFGTRSGNPDLEEEEGTSYTAGIVWDVFRNLTLTLDYYDIEVENIVGDESIIDLLQTEADCRLGETEDGEAVDINTQECQNAISRVGRLPDTGSAQGEALQTVAVGPINRALLHTTGIDASGRYILRTGSYGRFAFELAWSHVLTYDFAAFPDDPVEDLRDIGSPNDFTTFRSRTRGSISWDIEKWKLTLFGTRFGTIPSERDGRRLPPFIRWNATVAYEVNRYVTLSLIGNNIFDKQPQLDDEEPLWPFFSFFHYDVTGRELFGQVEVRFQ